jgi:uncharacterized protein involved in exopolysaccharide biosynthesis
MTNAKGITINLATIWQTLRQRWKFVLLSTIILTGLVIAGSYLLPNLYKASVVIFPGNSSLNDRNYYYNPNIQNLYSKFGGGDDIDRLMETSALPSIYDKIADSFKLAKAYNINENNPELAITKAGKKLYTDRSEITKTINNAIEIKVWDKDKQQAKAICNAMVYQLNKYLTTILNTQRESEINNLQQRISSLQASLNDSNKTTYNNATALQIHKQAVLAQLAEAEKLLVNVIANPAASQYIYVADATYVTPKKDKPKRTIIAGVAAFFALFLSAIAAVLIYYKKN